MGDSRILEYLLVAMFPPILMEALRRVLVIFILSKSGGTPPPKKKSLKSPKFLILVAENENCGYV